MDHGGGFAEVVTAVHNGCPPLRRSGRFDARLQAGDVRSAGYAAVFCLMMSITLAGW
jgi:hypothetical protein